MSSTDSSSKTPRWRRRRLADMATEIPIEELRAIVKRTDALLRRALRDGPPSRELDDLRTLAAERRIRLRKREAAEALEALGAAG